jgi:hypothetical protein
MRPEHPQGEPTCKLARVDRAYAYSDRVHHKLLQEQLHQAEERICSGEHYIATQVAIVSRLERDGHDATKARRVLAILAELQAMHVADRNRLSKELASL